ncbi:hypothetical protein [Leifsonia xyli]|uniref:hypothetical protein n=1 Tax=Leifsonia xyli TaxID=1575 RepID=UPI0003184E9D|nr:hypothetical protein [Leifsonia xyli]
MGTCATGAAGLAIVTGSPALTALAAGFLVFLIAAWLVVATRTAAAQVPGRVPAAPASAAHGTYDESDQNDEAHGGDNDRRRRSGSVRRPAAREPAARRM